MDFEINLWAVLGAAAASFVVGFLWYGPVFGKVWMKLSGMSTEKMKSAKLSPAVSMALGFVSSLVTAYVLAHFVQLAGVFDLGGVWQLSFWIWLGFFAAVMAGSVLWEGKPVKLYLLNIAYYLVNLFVMAWVLVRWQ